MTNPALAIIEEVYSMALNPAESYSAQLAVLGPSGELSSKLQTNTVLFKLCELIDKQEKKIDELQEKLQRADKITDPVDIVNSDPTKPLT